MPERPQVVAIGGGHGLANALRAIRRYAGGVTAVVTVAADSGAMVGLVRAVAPLTLALPRGVWFSAASIEKNTRALLGPYSVFGSVHGRSILR